MSTLNVDKPSKAVAAATESAKDTVLVPKLQAERSARVPAVPWPVHKTLVVGEGLDSAIAYGQFAADGMDGVGNMVKVAIELPVPASASSAEQNSASTAINIATAAEGLDALRESVVNSLDYERKWFNSNLPTLTQWLTSDLHPADPIKPAQRALISSLLDDLEATLTKEDAQQLALLASTTTSSQLETEMVSHLEQWAEKAHRELRDSLDEAFAGRNWRKLAWWKLFWRVDDVGMITEEMLARRWLVSAEKDATYLAGRMRQAGFPDEVRGVPVEVPAEVVEVPTEAIVDSTAKTPDINLTAPYATTFATSTDIPALQQSFQDHQPLSISTIVNKPTPWPALLAQTRTTLLATSIPPLQALAQSLILTTLSTTSLSAALSALLYASSSSVSLFEASSLAALGLTFSLRRMQKLWEEARAEWEAGVREEGRLSIKSTETVVRGIVARGGKAEEDKAEGVEERSRAREALGKVRGALERMQGRAGVRHAVEKARA